MKKFTHISSKLFTLLSGVCIGALLVVGANHYITPVYSDSNTVSAYVRNDYKIFVDGVHKPIPADYTILNYNDRVYVPIRFVSEAKGDNVDYDKASKRIMITVNKEGIRKELESEVKKTLENKYRKQFKDKDDEITSLKDRIKILEKSTAQVISNSNDSKGTAFDEYGTAYSTMPIKQNIDGFLLKLVAVYLDDDDKYTTRFYFYVKNESGDTYFVNNNTATLTYYDKYGRKQVIDSKDLSGYQVRDVKQDSIGDDTKSATSIVLPLIPDDCLAGTLEFKVENLDNKSKDTIVRFNVNLDRDKLISNSANWD